MSCPTTDNPQYYEQFDWERFDPTGFVAKKTEKILGMIPKDVSTIIDVGCGNGAITNVLAEKYKVTGVDRSRQALQYVRTDTIQSSSDAIDVPENSFDLVLASEILEHLEEPVFGATIQELKRISKKYILITVPNNESLEKDLIRCPDCGFVFNRSYHVRRFTRETLAVHFPEYAVRQAFTFGSGKRGYPACLAGLKHRFVPASAWISPDWVRHAHPEAMCPKCERVFHYGDRFHPGALFFDSVNRIFSPKKPYWLFVLLEKKAAHVHTH
jgi:SAM-dependent methyltransferase